MEVLWQNSSLPVKRLQRLALLQPIDEARLRPATEQTKADPRRSVSGKARICVIRRKAPPPPFLPLNTLKPLRVSRLLRSEISSRGGTAPRDGVWEHVRGVLPGRRCRVPRAARVLRAPILLGRRAPGLFGRRAPGPFGRRAPTLKDILHVSARSVLTSRNSLRINPVQHSNCPRVSLRYGSRADRNPPADSSFRRESRTVSSNKRACRP